MHRARTASPSRAPLAPRLALAALCAALAACGGRDERADSAAGRRAAADDPCGPDAVAQVTAAGVGPVRVGRRVGDLPASCVTRDTTFSFGEGIVERGRVVTVAGAPVLAVTTGSDGGVISRVVVTDPAFKTEQGVGVGSTVADLRRAQGQICAFEGEGRTVVQAASTPGVSYGISWSGANAPDELLTEVFGRAEPSAEIDTARVTRLWIHEGRAPCGGS